MAEMTHINREDETVLLKSKFYINVLVPSWLNKNSFLSDKWY